MVMCGGRVCDVGGWCDDGVTMMGRWVVGVAIREREREREGEGEWVLVGGVW